MTPPGDPIRLGLIGAGRIGQIHARAIAEHPLSQLAWVCDPVAEGAAETAARYGGTATSDVAAVLADPELRGIVIASPTPTHLDLVLRGVRAGLAVLCEKPIDLDIDRVDAFRDEITGAGQIVMVGFNRRFDPHIAELRRRVAAGDIGTLEHLGITSRDPSPPTAAYVRQSGGIFRDMAIHDFDMARFFVPHIVSVTAHTANRAGSDLAGAGDADSAVVTLRGAGDELITIVNSRHCASGYDQRLEATGVSGSLSIENETATLVRYSGATATSSREPYLAFFLQRYAEAYRNELAAFLTAIATGGPLSPSFEDGRAALVLADAAQESARDRRTVAVSLGGP